jgi:hypothetical protein
VGGRKGSAEQVSNVGTQWPLGGGALVYHLQSPGSASTWITPGVIA